MLVRIPFIYSFPVRHKTTGKQAGIAFLGVPRLGALFQNLITLVIPHSFMLPSGSIRLDVLRRRWSSVAQSITRPGH